MTTLPQINDLMETAPLGFALVDAKEGGVIATNPAFEALLCINGTLIGKNIGSIMGQEVLNPIYDRVPSFEYEFEVVPATGAQNRFLQLRADKLTEGGQVMYILWLLDVTSQKASESHLKELVDSTSKMAEMRASLLATMSHEMRTPMQAVYGFLELIAQESLPQHVKDMISSAKSAGSGLLEILDDVLDLAKLDADKMELESFDLAPKPFVRSVLDALAVRKKGKHIELVSEMDVSVPDFIKGDPKRLKQILVNLAGNAIKFTEEGYVKIRVTCRTKVLKNVPYAIRFEVVDTGIGMSEEQQQRLFNPFMQADNSTTRKFGGTGLGLSISKKLVELMKGQIGVLSSPGNGSNFWFEIPTVAVDAAEAESNLPSLSGIAVLLIEDIQQERNELIPAIKYMGGDVEYVDNYAEALAILRARPYDVVLIDQNGDSGGAVDVMKIIAEMRPNVGLVLHTAQDDHELQHTLRSFGAMAITKPATRMALGEAIVASAKVGQSQALPADKRILFAEDTQIVRDIIKRQLQSLGPSHPYDFVENGKQAWEALKSGQYGLVVTDLHMPEMDGYMLIRGIREEEKRFNKPRMPVIVLTADVQMSQRQTYMREGFDACLLKPVTLAQLSRLLIRWGVSEGHKSVVGDGNNAPPPAAPKMIPVTPERPAVDLKALAEQMGSVDTDSVGMIAMFPSMCVQLLQKLKAGLAQNDPKELREAAHSLKGAARSACCTVLGDLAASIQDAADNKQMESARPLIVQLLVEFERVRREIEKLKGEYGVS